MIIYSDLFKAPHGSASQGFAVRALDPALKGEVCRATDQDGFAATWNISSLSTAAQQQLIDGCIVLIGFYLANVLHDWRRGMAFGCALTMLYGALYGLLISENNALVLGSLLLFAVLAAVMVATRKVDWYQVGKAEPVPE